MNKDIIYPELSYKITGLLMRAQNDLGRFGKEKQYGDLFEQLLIQEKLGYKREGKINLVISENEIKGNRSDFIVNDSILVELKAIPFLTKQDYYQTMRYLKAGKLKLGLLVNMRNRYLKPKRILNSSVSIRNISIINNNSHR